ncbi:putative COPII-coated vesicle protein [Pseudovirgaria hyperparasitica]|uniref:Endoplasmic reticulum-Golgi intermediate compartment protein n=1 Tax=Pseudovirgaria hyperparasitica TaxID=470096 RepID=A0A6A6W809_9PEZI|nr:putative COPII-coated vesicle protein [Pseudovirgaria hyperparasitica]KAF2759028.1 putative COPII-coated vesicle protein [Pseudovirgaria hyperparasitica]
MDSYSESRLNSDDFAPAKGIVASFDAFPKTKATYLTKARNGSALTVLLLTTCAYLMMTETTHWWAGDTTHSFSVEKGVSHTLQMNMDVVVAMKCSDLHVNVQDAAGDRILAGETLKKDSTLWSQWGQSRDTHKLGYGAQDKPKLEMEEDVHDYLHAANRKKKFSRTPRFRGPPDACRIYGSLEGNKVQGDFHITARGHGYMEFGEHLDHNAFNFSHHINELSFGPFYPSLINPLDKTYATTELHFYKFQYYLSIVPTIYTTESKALGSSTPPSSSNSWGRSSNTVWTNQYAVTEQSHVVGESTVPGIFVKYDIEPITLTIAEEWGGLLALLVRLVNVISGVLVAGQWFYQIGDWAYETWLKRGRGRAQSQGVLTGRKSGEYSSNGYKSNGYVDYSSPGPSPYGQPQPQPPQHTPSYGYGMPFNEKKRSD